MVWGRLERSWSKDRFGEKNREFCFKDAKFALWLMQVDMLGGSEEKSGSQFAVVIKRVFLNTC